MRRVGYVRKWEGEVGDVFIGHNEKIMNVYSIL
jgi:hypothetical protein